MTTPFSPDQAPHAEALHGLALTAGGGIGYSTDPVFAWNRWPAEGRRVWLVSGGGAGHEPMHAGFLGEGGLDVAVPGEVFTSPHNGQIVAAVEHVAEPGAEVLLIVKNYTGDVINFAIARERLEAKGYSVGTLVVDDDLGSEGAEVGRRGTGATVVLEKILGAAADAGQGLGELLELGRRIGARTRSLAVARAAHTRPGGGEGFEVEQGSLEYGVGIHGETAAETIADPGVEQLVGRMVDELLDSLGHADAPAGTDYVVMVNGLGGVSNLELSHIAAQAAAALRGRGAELASLVAGTYISALDMRGFSLTLTAADDAAWVGYWIAPHAAPGLPHPRIAEAAEDAGPRSAGTGHGEEKGASSQWLDALAERFEGYREPLDALDQRSGDGDMGTNLSHGVRRAAERGAASPEEELDALAGAFLDEVGGSSGPLFGLVLSELARAERRGEGVRAGLEAVQRVGGAKPGDRTMLDALAPAAEHEELDAAAVRAAVEGAASTKDLRGRRGRASYLGERVLGAPDPGAVAMALVLHAVAERDGVDLEGVDAAGLLG
jgi:dihydroxyacetone kinase